MEKKSSTIFGVHYQKIQKRRLLKFKNKIIALHKKLSKTMKKKLPDNQIINEITTKIALFKGKEIRKSLHNGEWSFSVVDVCEALTDSLDAGAYWRKLKQRLTEEGSEVVTFCHGLKLPAPDGKMRETDCADTEG